MHTARLTSCLALALALAVALPAFAATPINESRPLSPQGHLTVENLKGRIEVRAWDRPEVKIEGSLGRGVERLIVEGDGQRLRVAVKYPTRTGVFRFGSNDRSEPTTLRLMVPLQADLKLAGVSSDILAWGVAPASVRVENVSGDTTIVGAPREIRVESVSGDVDLTLNRAKVTAESVSGDVRISGRLGDEVSVETVSGRVDLQVLDTPVRRLEGASVSGDLQVRTALAPRARVTLESVSGDIGLQLPRGASAEVRAETFSGKLTAPGATIERPRHGPGASMRQRYGSGDADVSIETFSGSASLRID